MGSPIVVNLRPDVQEMPLHSILCGGDKKSGGTSMKNAHSASRYLCFALMAMVAGTAACSQEQAPAGDSGAAAPAPQAASEIRNAPDTDEGQWGYLGGDAAHTRYTPADEINLENFEDLEEAWVWDGASFNAQSGRSTPSYINGRLYTVAGPRRYVVALDPANGELIWSCCEAFRTTRSHASLRNRTST